MEDVLCQAGSPVKTMNRSDSMVIEMELLSIPESDIIDDMILRF